MNNFGQQEISGDTLSFKLKTELSKKDRLHLQKQFQSLDSTQGPVNRAHIHNNIATTYFVASYYLKTAMYDSIKYHSNKALLLTKDRNSELAVEEYVRALYFIGRCHRQVGEYATALTYFFEAADILKKFPDPKALYKSREIVTTEIVLVYEAVGSCPLAIEQYETLLGYVEKHRIDPKKTSSILYIFLARFYRETNRPDKALFYAHKGLEIAKRCHKTIRVAMGYLELAAIELELEDDEEANLFLSKAYILLKEVEETVYLSDYYYIQSILAGRSENFSTMILYAEKAFGLLQQQRVSQKHVRTGKLLSEAYKKVGEFKKASEILEKTTAMERILTNNEEINKGMILEIQRKENSIIAERRGKELEQARSHVKSMVIIIVLGLFIFVAFFALYIFKDRRQKLRLTAAIQEKNTQLEQLDLAKSQFFANISHELRTPLTLISSPVQHLLNSEKDSLNTNQAAQLKMVAQNAGQLKDLVNDILDLSKLESDRLELQEDTLSLVPFLRKVTSNFSSLAQHLGIRYEMTSDLAEDPYVLLDKDKVEKIINNLLSNAIKHTPSGGSVQFTITKEDQRLQFRVIDTGQGIPEEDLSYIFDRYFQSKDSHESLQGGTGIGLALAKELTQLMKGTLSVESTLGEGSTFLLSIPYKETAAIDIADAETGFEEDEDSFTAVEKEAVTVIADRTYSVLIVEDHPDMQSFIRQLLGHKYHTFAANHGKQALEILSRESIDLIVSDVMMPEMDGYTLLQELKNHDSYFNIPVIMLTSLNRQDNRLQALTLGVDDYLNKPFFPEELIARVHNLLERYEVRRIVVKEKELEQEAGKLELNGIVFEDLVPEEQTKPKDLKWIKEVENNMRKELENPEFNIGALAGKFSMSLRQFQRKMKKVTGLTPKKFQQEVALQESRKLLEKKSHKTVKAIAYTVGMYNVWRFSQLYEKRFGNNPNDYF